MPHIPNTPESSLSRSDSRDPATTCRGITASGLPCRRALAPPNSSPPKTPLKPKGRQNTDPSTLYCWQHKDQAPSVMQGTNSTLDHEQKRPRTSIDTLMDRLGVLDIRDTQNRSEKHRYPMKGTYRPQKKKSGRLLCCCFEIIEEDDAVPAKPVHPSPENRQHSGPYSYKPNIGQPQSSSLSQANPLNSWIPPTISAQTTSLLLAELAKPISDADEPGYIYMFWITPSSSPTSKPPPREIALSLVPMSDTPEENQRTSDAIRTARGLNTLSSKPTGCSPGTVRLKIGRTSNVQRRLNEWTRQCSSHLTLIRYYPYSPSSARRSPQRQSQKSTNGEVVGRKVPHVHRVERLIHIELADIRSRDLGQCQECGKEHREWFEVAAERTALRRVDDCIRRWVKWAESQQ